MDAEAPATLSPLQSRKRAAILMGARAVFLRDGFATGSVDDVAAAAGVGKQTVYRHFGSKEALIVGLVETMCGDLAGAVLNNGSLGDAGAEDQGDLAVGAEPAGSPEAKLRLLGEAAVRSLTTRDSLALYRAIVAEAERMPQLGRLFHEAGPCRLRALVADLLEETLGFAAPQRAEQFVQVALGEAYLEMVLGIAEPSQAGPNEALSPRVARQVDAAVEIALR